MTPFRSSTGIFREVRPEPERSGTSADALLHFDSETDSSARLRTLLNIRTMLIAGSAIAALVAVLVAVYFSPGQAAVDLPNPPAIDTSAPAATPPLSEAADTALRTSAPPSAPIAPVTEPTPPGAAREPAAAVASAGRLDITSDPPGARIQLNGEFKGVTPLQLDTVPAGTHEVTLLSSGTTVRRRVRVNAGATGTVVASFVTARPPTRGTSAGTRAAAPAEGWLALDLPFEADVLERGRRLGTSRDRIALAPGAHELEIRNASLGVSDVVAVDIRAGQTTRPTLHTPTGLVSINATPWAEVTIDGRSYGTTPLANIVLAVGTHDLVLRHPQLGEQRRSIRVTAGTPVRMGVSFAR